MTLASGFSLHSCSVVFLVDPMSDFNMFPLKKEVAVLFWQIGNMRA